ncbi:hypothetical protein LTR10_009719 [Elasticomyces elasticus]|nr:hypothetical protein LTR10_009719 [Elasticomyces elasticus]KAK4970008.1 hypothetical protein LTR42_008175 [Elasticomyces elasticus]
MNSDQHDELAQLFAANMQVSYQQQEQQQQPQQEQQHQPEPVQIDVEKVEQGPMHYISSHYTGTAHIIPTNTIASPSRSPPPSYGEATMPQAMAEMLKQNGVDPSSLLPNQIHLFANADQEQRGRLLELWRISPPSYPLEQHLSSAGMGMEVTSVEQEEAEARERYQQREEEQQQQQQRAHEEWGLDTHIPPQQQEPTPLSPIREPGEPAWPPAARMRAASILAAARQTQPTPPQAAEPYMSSGYQQSSHTDPVYAAAPTGLWQQPTPGYGYGSGYAEAMARDANASRMEDSYGQFEQIRNHAEWEAMQERVARERLMFVGGGDDMVM